MSRHASAHPTRRWPHARPGSSTKPNRSRFCRCRSACTDLGIMIVPFSICHRRITCAFGDAMRSARCVRSHHRRRCRSAPRAIGEYASTAILCALQYATTSRCCHVGCSSIWLTAGYSPVSLCSRSRCSGRKLHTPSVRTRPSARNSSNAFHVSPERQSNGVGQCSIYMST